MTTTVDATLARMFREYPSLFRTRLDALDQLFVVNGNGLEWRSGALVDRFREDPHPDRHPSFSVSSLPRRLASQRSSPTRASNSMRCLGSTIGR